MSWTFPEKFLAILYAGEDDAGHGGIQADPCGAILAISGMNLPAPARDEPVGRASIPETGEL
jgi:hypothetical protein